MTDEFGKTTPGNYRHFKGTLYRAIGEVWSTETEEWMVHYMALEGPHKGKGCVRPVAMFHEEITKHEIGYVGPRFRLVARVTEKDYD